MYVLPQYCLVFCLQYVWCYTMAWYGARVPDLIQLYVKSHALGLLCFLWHLTLLFHVSDTTCSVVGSFADPYMLCIWAVNAVDFPGRSSPCWSCNLSLVRGIYGASCLRYSKHNESIILEWTGARLKAVQRKGSLNEAGEEQMIPMGNYLPRVKDAVLCSDKRASSSITAKCSAGFIRWVCVSLAWLRFLDSTATSWGYLTVVILNKSRWTQIQQSMTFFFLEGSSQWCISFDLQHAWSMFCLYGLCCVGKGFRRSAIGRRFSQSRFWSSFDSICLPHCWYHCKLLLWALQSQDSFRETDYYVAYVTSRAELSAQHLFCYLLVSQNTKKT